MTAASACGLHGPAPPREEGELGRELGGARRSGGRRCRRSPPLARRRRRHECSDGDIRRDFILLDELGYLPFASRLALGPGDSCCSI